MATCSSTLTLPIVRRRRDGLQLTQVGFVGRLLLGVLLPALDICGVPLVRALLTWSVRSYEVRHCNIASSIGKLAWLRNAWLLMLLLVEQPYSALVRAALRELLLARVGQLLERLGDWLGSVGGSLLQQSYLLVQYLVSVATVYRHIGCRKTSDIF